MCKEDCQMAERAGFFSHAQPIGETGIDLKGGFKIHISGCCRKYKTSQ